MSYEIDPAEFIISRDGKNAISSLLASKTSVFIDGIKSEYAVSVDLLHPSVDYILTDRNNHIIAPQFLTEQEIGQYQHSSFTIHDGYITKRVRGKFTVTIDVTPDGEK